MASFLAEACVHRRSARSRAICESRSGVIRPVWNIYAPPTGGKLKGFMSAMGTPPKSKGL